MLYELLKNPPKTTSVLPEKGNIGIIVFFIFLGVLKQTVVLSQSKRGSGPLQPRGRGQTPTGPTSSGSEATPKGYPCYDVVTGSLFRVEDFGGGYASTLDVDGSLQTGASEFRTPLWIPEPYNTNSSSSLSPKP